MRWMSAPASGTPRARAPAAAAPARAGWRGVSMPLLPWNGGRPASISCSTMPNEKMSLRASTRSPRPARATCRPRCPARAGLGVVAGVRREPASPRLGQLGQAEVDDLDLAGLGDHHVGGLEIAMHDPRCVCRARPSAISAPVPAPAHGDRPGPVRRAASAPDQLHGDEGEPVGLVDLVDAAPCGCSSVAAARASCTKRRRVRVVGQIPGRTLSATRGRGSCRARGRRRPSRPGRSPRRRGLWAERAAGQVHGGGEY